MALIKCKYCGHEISDKAAKCPVCGKRNNRTLLMIGSFVLAMCVIGILLIILNPRVVGELTKQNENNDSGGKKARLTMMYSNAEKRMKSFDSKLSVISYDISVRADVISFYEAIVTLKEDIHSGKSIYSSINEFAKEAAKFDELEINEDSEYGKYIYNMQYLSMYPFFRTEYIENNSTDYDSGLVRSGYVYIIDVYLDDMLSNKPPNYK